MWRGKKEEEEPDKNHHHLSLCGNLFSLYPSSYTHIGTHIHARAHTSRIRTHGIVHILTKPIYDYIYTFLLYAFFFFNFFLFN